MTPQQLKFARAYALGLNGTQAALKAGYASKSARSQASRLLTNDDIRAKIQQLLAKSGLSPEEIAARWDRIATVDLSDFYTRERVEHTPRIEKPLAEIVAEHRAQVDFEQQLAIRQEELISDIKKRRAFRKSKQRRQLAREMEMARLELELELDPAATRFVNGPTEWREELRLDLVKAEELGVLDLVKSITHSPRGTSFSLRDPDAALDNLAKWRGMTTKLDITSGGEPIAAPPLLALLTLEEKKSLLEKRRLLLSAPAPAQEGPASV